MMSIQPPGLMTRCISSNHVSAGPASKCDQMLIANPRRVLTRSRILEEVWGYDFPTTGNALEVYIGYLRRKTEAEGEPRLIHTVRGIGYVLRADA